MQQYADIYSVLNYFTCFGRPSRLSSGVHKTVFAASGTDHTVWGASFFKSFTKQASSSVSRSLFLYSFVQFHLVPAKKQTAVSVWHMPVSACTVLNSWWWTERPSETCRVSFQNKIIWYIGASSLFCYRNILRCTALWTSNSFWIFETINNFNNNKILKLPIKEKILETHSHYSHHRISAQLNTVSTSKSS